MKCVGIYCFVAVGFVIASPAFAGEGNALAGGWNGQFASRATLVVTTVPTSGGQSTHPQSLTINGRVNATNFAPGPGGSEDQSVDFGLHGEVSRNLAAPGPETGVGLAPIVGLVVGWYALRRRHRALAA